MIHMVDGGLGFCVFLHNFEKFKNAKEINITVQEEAESPLG